ncbi:MAG: hypothetical protein EA417_06925 [Gammaproteobacteria bacterium]|nr:MAG: hypothetical protein EA417_06925 [Gammaproteobacteria bacterium]
MKLDGQPRLLGQQFRYQEIPERILISRRKRNAPVLWATPKGGKHPVTLLLENELFERATATMGPL